MAEEPDSSGDSRIKRNDLDEARQREMRNLLGESFRSVARIELNTACEVWEQADLCMMYWSLKGLLRWMTTAPRL